MQRTRYGLLAVMLLVFLVLCAVPAAQAGEKRLSSYTVSGQFMNDQIYADTLSNGQRRDSSCVYVLTRGSLYLVNAAITNSGWSLGIKAQDSAGSRPVILLADAQGSTRPPGSMVTVRANLFFKNLIISGFDERDPNEVGGLQGNLLNMTAAGYNIVIDSCILTNSNGNHVRTDAAPHLIKITNSIFANMGYLGTSNLGAGKAIDVRAGSVDSLVVVNTTFVNWQDRIIRHYSSTANINYLRFEHNTLVNGMSYHGLLSLGRMGKQAAIVNNLIVDGFALGNDTDAVRQAEFTDSGEKDQWAGARMTWVISNPNDTTKWNIRNNYYAVSDSGQAFYTNAGANPALTEGSPLTWHLNTKVGADSAKAFQKISLTFNNVPKVMTEFMRWYRKPIALGGAGKTKGVVGWSAAVDYDRRTYRYYRDSLDCKYPTGSALYTAASGGYPIGDLNWFPTKKVLWDNDPVATDVADESGGMPEAYALSQNYPNPFNPSTTISFSLPKGGNTTLVVYNLLGQKVSTLVAAELPAGQHKVSLNASNLSSGVYFYRLQSGRFIEVKKMMLLR